MSKNTQRITARGLDSRAQFELAIDEIATLQTKSRLLCAKRDKRIQAVQDEYGPEISEVSEQIDALLVQAERYAETHRDELFTGGTKSAETALATFGFRTGNPTLKTLTRKWTWETVLEAVKRRWKDRFVRTKEELSKDVMKAELTEAELAEVGCRVEQSETFGVTPKVDGGEVVTA